MTTEQKALKVAAAARKMAAVIDSEGDHNTASLFREMAECSTAGLAALYDALSSDGHGSK